ncbi:MAG TPA: hypothetical protein VLC09_12165 [Polyangiaceae bacterium]|nr:hypothetical protein [Polyangiaceae bacterium]
MTRHTVLRIRSSALALCALTTLATPAWADTLVPPAKATNVSPGDTAALEQLFVDAYSVAAQERVLVTRTEENGKHPEDAAAEAARVGANEYVVLSFIGLGEQIQIRASRHSTDGKVIHSVKTTATNMADAGQVIDRIAEALHKRETFEQTRKAGNATQVESQTSEKIMGVKTAAFIPWSPNTSYQPYMTIGFDGRIEMDSFFIEVGAGFGFPLATTYTGTDPRYTVGGVYGEFGGSVYLTDTEVAPYLGGGVLPRILWYSDQNSVQGNMAAYLQGGLMFMRSRSTRLYLDYRFVVNLSEVNFVHPLENGIQFGIGW